MLFIYIYISISLTLKCILKKITEDLVKMLLVVRICISNKLPGCSRDHSFRREDIDT